MITAQRLGSRLARHRGVRVSAAIVAAIAVLAVLGPVLSPHDHLAADFDRLTEPPALAAGHVFGTDDLGRDLFVRTMLGIRVTLAVAIVASLVSLVIGVAWGAVAGFAGGRVDALMMRAVDALYAMPFIFFVILLMALFDRSMLLIFVAIGAVNWLDMARIVRGQTLSLKEREFVEAARLTGVPAAAIITRHIAPNLVGVVIVYVTLSVPQAILVESFLSFLGLGIQEPDTSLGTLVNAGVAHIGNAPWMLVIPAAFLALTLMCLNYLGDGLRDAFDARTGA